MKNYKFAFLLILILGLTLRLWKLNIPLLEFYPTRQVQTAEITQNLIKDNFNFLYPRVDYYGPENIYYLYEFPGYNLIVAGVHKLLGNINDINGRIVSIFSYLAASVFLYKIVGELFSKQISLITILFFSLSPLHVLISRSFQPDEMMLASSLGVLYFLLLWSKKRLWKFLFFSCLLFAWAALIKIVAVFFLFLPISYLLLRGNRKKYSLLPILYFLIALVPSVLWYFHTFNVSTKLNTASSTAFNIFIWFGPENLINPKYYSTIFGHEYTLVILPIGMVLFLIGLTSKLSKGQMVMYWWLAGVIAYFLFFNKHNMTHEYYHLPFLPIASVFIAIGADKVINDLNGLIIPKKLLILLLAVLVLILMLPPVLDRAYKPIDRFANVVEAAEALKQVSNPNDLVVGIMDRGPTLVYYSERIGWHFGLDREEQLKEEEFYTGSTPQLTSPINDLKKYKDEGAKYLAISDIDQFSINAQFKEYVTNNFQLLKGTNEYLIFNLTK